LQGKAGFAPRDMIASSTKFATSSKEAPNFTRGLASASTSARIRPALLYFSNISVSIDYT